MNRLLPLLSICLFAFTAEARIYCEVVIVKDPANQWFVDYLMKVRDDRTSIQDMRTYGNAVDAELAQKRCQAAVGGAECLEVKGNSRYSVGGLNLPNATYSTLNECSQLLVSYGAKMGATEPPPPSKPKKKENLSPEMEREMKRLQNELRFGPKF